MTLRARRDHAAAGWMWPKFGSRWANIIIIIAIVANTGVITITITITATLWQFLARTSKDFVAVIYQCGLG